MTSERGDSVRVHVRDCMVMLHVGIYEHEKPKPQPVVVHVEARGALTQHYSDIKASAMDLVINYEELYTYITSVLPGLGHIPLLESVADNIITFCFKDPRIDEVRVRLDKPEAFKGRAMVGVELRRKRKAK